MTTLAALPADLPSEMKAIIQPDIHSIKLIQSTIPIPKPTHPDDVLVGVKATSPCAGELLWAANFPDVIPADKTPIPCPDLAGVVVASPAHSAFKPGDEVYARVDASRPGAGAEYVLAKERELAIKPKSLDWVQTAATPLSALTAYQALFNQGTLDPAGLSPSSTEARSKNGSKRVLVTGASGGVGSWVVQLAAAAGAGAVVAVAGKGKEEAVRSLGATEVVDYTQTTIGAWAAEVPTEREVDLVIDCIGGGSLVASWDAVKGDGSAAIISIAGMPDMVKPDGNSKTLAKSVFFIVDPLGAQLVEIGKLIDAGTVKPVVDSVWEFGQFEKAFERLQGGHAKGKIIIKVDGSA